MLGKVSDLDIMVGEDSREGEEGKRDNAGEGLGRSEEG